MKKTKIIDEDRKNIVSRFFSKIFIFIKDKIYDLQVLLKRKFKRNSKQRSMQSVKRGKLFFVIFWMIIPMAIWLVFYLVNRVYTVVLSFQTRVGDGFQFLPINAIFTNYGKFFNDIANATVFKYAWGNSFLLWGITFFLGTVLHLFNAFYVYKKYFGHAIFGFFLYVPTILSSVILVTMYKNFMVAGLGRILKNWFGYPLMDVITDPSTGFWMQIIYSVWAGFGGGVIFYCGLMARIPKSLVEAAELDGITMVKEFWYITLPLIYDVLAIQFATGITGIFMGQGALYTFFGPSLPYENFYTVGYYFYNIVIGPSGGGNPNQFPLGSASSVIFTLIVAPISLFLRWALVKFGPSDVSY